MRSSTIGNTRQREKKKDLRRGDKEVRKSMADIGN